MRITYNWLLEFIDVSDLSPFEVADILTNIGIEVEGVENPAKEIEGVLTGKILEIKKHPNADRLLICKVDVGREKPLQIITGAKNVFESAVVPVALHGARIKTGRIKRTKLRGELSEGMLCSETELGIGESSEGIMILDSSVPVGKDIKEVLGIDDWIIEYEITTNRPDTLSVLGIARELKGFLGRKINLPKVYEGEVKQSEKAHLEVQEKKLCPRYEGILITDIKNAESPLKIKTRLQMVGLRPINAVVDITNYVLFELGQPMHAFDFEKIRNGKVIVRTALNGEKVVLLDGSERELTEEDLVIADDEKVIALAGVMGCSNTAVELETKTILLESAHFDPTTIRKTGKRLGISTESSYRFERGADIEMCEFALRRAVHLILETVGGKVEGKVSYYPKKYQPKIITFSPEKAVKLLGVNIPARKSTEILANLGFTVKKEQDFLTVRVPSWRKYDVSREVDLIEEVLRIYGMENVKSKSPLFESKASLKSDFEILTEIKEFLASKGLNEVINYSFVSKELYGYFNLNTKDLIEIPNPLSEEHRFMRNYVFPSLVKNAVENINRYETDVSIFEVSRVFIKGNRILPDEPVRLGILLTGRTKDKTYTKRKVDFYDIKGIVESVFSDLFGVFPHFKETSLSFLHPKQSAEVSLNGKRLGFLGKLHPDVIEKLEVNQEIFIAEIELGELINLSRSRVQIYSPISKHPPLTRDIAVLVDERTKVKEVERIIVENGKFIESVELFDIYSGPGIPEGKKSVGFSIRFRAKDRTLSDEEVNEILNGIIDAIKKAGFSIRG